MTEHKRSKLLGESLKTVIKRVTGISGVYTRLAPPAQKPPFVVINTQLMRKAEGIRYYDVSVDVCDYASKEDAAESIADCIEDSLDYMDYHDAAISWRTWVNGNQTVEESDKTIQHRKLSFELRLYERNG